MQKRTIKQKFLAWITALAVAVTFIPTTAGIAFAAANDGTNDFKNATITLPEYIFLNNVYIGSEAEDKYEARPAEPPVEVKIGDNVVNPNDYDVTYKNNDKPGDAAEVTITGKGGNYGAEDTKTVNFKILEQPKVALEYEGQQEEGKNEPKILKLLYTGGELKPTLKSVVTVDGTDITGECEPKYYDTRKTLGGRAAYIKAGTWTVSAEGKGGVGEEKVYGTALKGFLIYTNKAESFDVKQICGGEVVKSTTITEEELDAIAETNPELTYYFKRGENKGKRVCKKYVTFDKFLELSNINFKPGDELKTIGYDGYFPKPNYTYEDLIAADYMAGSDNPENKFTTVLRTKFPEVFALELADGSPTLAFCLGGANAETMPGGGRFPTGVREIQIITPGATSLADMDVDVKNATYTGKRVAPKVTIMDGDYELVEGVDYNVVSKARNVGAATATINGIGAYEGAKDVKFKINPKRAKIKNAKSGKRYVTARWYRQSGKMSKSRISGYKVQISKTGDFSKDFKTMTVKGYKKTARTTKWLNGKKISRKTTYYVRVQTYKRVGGVNYYSTWSPVKKVRTK
ncbi:MAG: hypothetical protein ACOX4R_04110 [Lentihominibacter sp.]|jgi:hypothetical protein